jgi:hypothetical protein
MKSNITLADKAYFRLLMMVPAIALLGFAGCSSVTKWSNGNHRESYSRISHSGYVTISPREYNPESRSFDRPWPFGPESDQQ